MNSFLDRMRIFLNRTAKAFTFLVYAKMRERL
jgi:hypothetical protein